MTPANSVTDLYCTVISLVPVPLNEFKPGLMPGHFHLAASDTKIPQILHVGTCKHNVYLDEDRGQLPVRTPSTEVARSIVIDYVNSQLCIGEGRRPALFWVTGKFSQGEILTQFKDNLDAERAIQKNWLIELCKMADSDWAKSHQHNVISELQRLAAQLIGWRVEDHEWISPRSALESVVCPSCGNHIAKDVVVCGHCSCILKPEIHKTLQYANAPLAYLSK
jgi:hypothetical protein